MKIIIGGLIIAILVIAGFGVGTAVVLGVAYGFGWLVTQIIEVTLFEGMILAMAASLIFSMLLSRIIEIMAADVDADDAALDSIWERPFNDNKIPLERFEVEETGSFNEESLFRYHVANAVFDGLDNLPRSVGMNSEQQIIELAVRLTDPMVNILKRRKKKVSVVTISKAALIKELRREGLRPYDDDILETAVEYTNLALDNLDMVELVNGKLWHMPLDAD